MASAVPVPEAPGRIFIPATNSVVQQDSQYEGDVYDTVEFRSFATGTKQDVFKTQDNKNLQHTNLTQTKRVPSYTKLKLVRLGVFVRQIAGTARPDPEDVVAMYELAYIRFTLGVTNIIAEGPVMTYPSGFGLAGISNRGDFSALSLGVPSPAAAPVLREQVDLNDKMDLNCRIQIDDQTWLNAADQGQPTMIGNGTDTHVLVSVYLHGVITRPLGA